MGAFKCQYTLEAEKKVHEKLATREGDEIMSFFTEYLYCD
jgi:hypothetical protein